jgi:hypothetical protein
MKGGVDVSIIFMLISYDAVVTCTLYTAQQVKVAECSILAFATYPI